MTDWNKVNKLLGMTPETQSPELAQKNLNLIALNRHYFGDNAVAFEPNVEAIQKNLVARETKRFGDQAQSGKGAIGFYDANVDSSFVPASTPKEWNIGQPPQILYHEMAHRALQMLSMKDKKRYKKIMGVNESEEPIAEGILNYISNPRSLPGGEVKQFYDDFLSGKFKKR